MHGVSSTNTSHMNSYVSHHQQIFNLAKKYISLHENINLYVVHMMIMFLQESSGQQKWGGVIHSPRGVALDKRKVKKKTKNPVPTHS